jgi:hypothetical protein
LVGRISLDVEIITFWTIALVLVSIVEVVVVTVVFIRGIVVVKLELSDRVVVIVVVSIEIGFVDGVEVAFDYEYNFHSFITRYTS